MPTNTARRLSRRGFLGTCGALLALNGCGWGKDDGSSIGSDDAEVALKVWDQFSTSPQRDAVRKIYNLFVDKHDKLGITPTSHNGDQMTTVGKTALASGTGPDVIYYSVGKGTAGVLADADLIQPLDDIADKYGWRHSIAPFALQEASLDGKLYGLPNESEVGVLYYNKTLIEDAGLSVPETFDDLLTFVGDAAETDHVPIAYGQLDVYPSWWALSLMANNALGAKATGDLVFGDKGSWDDPRIIEAIQLFFVDLVDAGGFADDLNSINASDAQALFLSGDAMMGLNGSWAVADVEESLKGSEIGIMPMPSIGGSDRVYPAGSGSAYYISAKSEHADEAAMLLDFLYTPEIVRIWIEEAGVFPPVESDTAQWNLSELRRTALEAATSGGGDAATNLGYFVNHGNASPQFLETMTSGFQAVVAGDKTPEEQATDLQKAWEQGLAD